MIRRPPRSTLSSSSAASDVYKRQNITRAQYFSLDTKGSSFIESLIRYGNNAKTVKNSSQQSLFGETGGFDMIKPEPSSCPDWPKLEKLNREKEVIGIYLSSHPLDDFKLEISTFTTATLADLQTLREYLDRDVVVAGMVTDIRTGIGKNGKPYGSFTLQDYSDSCFLTKIILRTASFLLSAITFL